VLSRKSIVLAFELMRFGTHKELERFAILYDLEDCLGGGSIQDRSNSLLKHLLGGTIDRVVVEEIVEGSVNEELKRIETNLDYFDDYGGKSFEDKHPKLYESLTEDGFLISENRLKKITVTEVVRHNKNEKLELIHKGEGSYAHVYSYTDPHYKQIFALKRAKKTLTEQELSRFKNEYLELSKLDSPYIVKVYNYSDDKEEPEYTMEFVPLTLQKYIVTNNTKISSATRISIVQQILKAFLYIRSKDRLHRDISTSNVLIKIHDDGSVIAKVSDFGLVKVPHSTLTEADSSIKGSLNDSHLSIVGFDKYEERHEVYALSRLINFVLTGNTNGGLYNKNQEVHDFLYTGHDDFKERYSSVSELAREFARVKTLIK